MNRKRPSHRRHAALGAIVLALAACSGGASARDTAIENLTTGSDAMTQTQAECVVDEVGEDRLADFDNFSADFQRQIEGQVEDLDPAELSKAAEGLSDLLGTFFSCAFSGVTGLDALEGLEGLENLEDLFATPPVEGEDGFEFDNTAVDCSTAEVDGPCERGDDADLDDLWDACDDGDGSACDELYLQAPFGSRYEQFANRCGDREDPGFSDCAGKYKP